MRRKKENMWNQVQRFSIRKFSFGVTSALIGTFFLANAPMVQAEVESGTDSAVHTTKPEENVGMGKPNENVQPAVATENKKVETNVGAEETGKASKEQVTGVTTPKADKSTLSQVIDTLSELLNQVNLKKVSRTSMLEYEGVLSKAKEVFQNDSATQLEVDSQVVKVNSAITIAKSFPKVKAKTGENVVPKDETLETPKTETEIKHSLEMVKEDLQKYVKKSEITTDKPNVTAAEEILENISKQLENTTLTSKELTALLEQAKTVRNTLVNEELRANSGARDSRNNQRMGEGAGFRADGVRVEGALTNVKEYISEPAGQGSTAEGQRTRTIEKTFMTAKYSKEGNKKFITYDVYFQNDGKALDGSTGNAFWFYPPRDILYSGGSYVGDTIAEAYYERYQKNAGATGILSHNPNSFTKVDTYNALEQLRRNGTNQDDSTRRQWGDAISLYQLDGGPARRNPSQVQQMLKKLQDNPELNSIIRLNNNPTGSLPELSYSQLLTISGGRNYAFKYHVKMRLRDDVTAEQAQKAGTIAVTAKEGKSITAYAAYVYSATGTKLETRPDAQLYPIQGSTHEKTVGDSIPNSGNPVADGYVTRKGGGDFPSGMSWSWKNNIAPSTANAGKFTYTAIATYGDQTTSEDVNSGSDGQVHFTVKPKKPVITASDVEHKKGLTGQSITVNVGSGVKAGSTVKLYDGNTVIGTGTTNGQTATVVVSGALPGKPITAETIVDNGGVVTSVRSDAVTPTEVPDNVAPTVSINGKALTANADDNRFIIYRGANFNPTFKVRDDKNNATLSITGLPNGVESVSKNGSKEFDYTIPDNSVATDAPLGESIATVVANDGRNSATYKFKYRIVDKHKSRKSSYWK